MLKIGLAGAAGRMGQAVIQAIALDDKERCQLSAAIHSPTSDLLGRDVGETGRHRQE